MPRVSGLWLLAGHSGSFPAPLRSGWWLILHPAQSQNRTRPHICAKAGRRGHDSPRGRHDASSQGCFHSGVSFATSTNQSETGLEGFMAGCRGGLGNDGLVIKATLS